MYRRAAPLGRLALGALGIVAVVAVWEGYTKNETGATIISKPPPESAYSNTYVEAALKELKDEGRRRRQGLPADRGDPQGGRQ